MAQHALPPGATRRRAAFGLLDAEGWGWAGVKATWWFLVIIFLLGYVPNVVYYATVSDTVEVGANFISPVNWCPASNKDLPCPAPAGAVVPWESTDDAASSLNLPVGLVGATAVQSGTHLYLVGGRLADGSVNPVTYATTATLDGNFHPWTEGPALPEPRADAAYASFGGVPYVIGGEDASGNLTTTVFVGVLDKGELTGWALADGQEGRLDLALDTGLAGAATAIAPDGIWLLGGRTADGPTTSVWRAAYADETDETIDPWVAVEGAALPEARVDAAAAFVGDHLYLLGGSDGRTASRTVFQLETEDALPLLSEASGLPEGWHEAPEGQSIPDARARASFINASGTLYLIGGVNAQDALQFTTLWAVSDADGDLTWRYLDQSNLPADRADASAALVGATAFIIGGEGDDGAATNAFRGDISPRPPFLQLGILGATLPGLSIKGEIGQQLGYINAMTVGMINFGLLVAIGVAFSHKRQTLQLFEKLSRGRFRAPREDEFTPGT